MMGFDPRKWLSGLGPQQQPKVDQFSGAPYGQFGAPTMQDAMRFRTQQGRPKPTFNQGAYKAAQEDWAFDEDIRQRKMAKFAELMEYGQKDLNPRPPSHTFVGESGGVEVSWPDMIGEQAYLDLDQPIDRLTSYEDEAERRRRALLARYLA